MFVSYTLSKSIFVKERISERFEQLLRETTQTIHQLKSNIYIKFFIINSNLCIEPENYDIVILSTNLTFLLIVLALTDWNGANQS